MFLYWNKSLQWKDYGPTRRKDKSVFPDSNEKGEGVLLIHLNSPNAPPPPPYGGLTDYPAQPQAWIP